MSTNIGTTKALHSLYGSRFGIGTGYPGSASLILDGNIIANPYGTTAAPELHGSIQLTAGNLMYESSSDNITALAGGGQTGATQLTSELNRITTVASVGDSVMLPASAAGLTICVINNGANACQVFGSGSDTVDGNAAATGVSQMKGSTTFYCCTTAGAWETNGIAEGYSGSFLTQSYSSGLVALAGGGYSSASSVTINSMLTNIATCATTSNSIMLPPASPGIELTVLNNGANPAAVFPSQNGVTDSINALTSGASFPIPNSSNPVIFFCAFSGKWYTK